GARLHRQRSFELQHVKEIRAGDAVRFDAKHGSQIIITRRLIVVSPRERANWCRIGKIGKSEIGEGTVGSRTGLDTLKELAPHRLVQWTIDVVVGGVRADLIARIQKVAAR